MFAVAGWSVSSKNLKTQTLQPLAPMNSPKPPPTNSDEPTKISKKRKRSNGKSHASVVNATNLADLWETIIEGKPKAKKEKLSLADKESRDIGRIGTRQHPAEDNPPQRNTEIANDTAQGDPIKKSKSSSKKKKKGQKNGLHEAKCAPPDTKSSEQLVARAPLPTSIISTASLTPLQASMRQKLVSARFRHLNQTLYTTPSAHSLELFQQNPEMFHEYHEGFRRQVEVWPENPVDSYIRQIRARGMQRSSIRNNGIPPGKEVTVFPLPRTAGTSHIADLGCGDAMLAQGLQTDSGKLKLKIYSYDLQNPSPVVTKADIADLPLEDGRIDIAIFCLALMGTNWIEFVEEAYRILRWKGELWVAEIKSRFGRVGGRRVEHSVGNRNKKPDKKVLKRYEEEGEEQDLAVEVDGQEDNKQATDVSSFVEVLRKRGFVLQGQPDLTNKMFVKIHFVKGLTPIKGKHVPVPKGMAEMGIETWKKKPKAKFIDDEDAPVSNEAGVLKPCVYKLR